MINIYSIKYKQKKVKKLNITESLQRENIVKNSSQILISIMINS